MLEIRQSEGASLVTFRDNTILDTLAVQRVGRALYELVEQPAARPIIIDFQNVRFLSSQALGVLLTLRRRADSRGVPVALAGLRPELSRVFALTKLDQVFLSFATADEAVRHFGTPPAKE